MNDRDTEDVNATPPTETAPENGPNPDRQHSIENPEPEEDRVKTFTGKVAGGLGKAAKASREAVDRMAREAECDLLPTIDALDRLLDWARRAFPAERYSALCAWCTKYGHLGLLAAQILVVLFGFVAAIVLRSWVMIFYGGGLALLLWFLQYTAYKFLDAGEHMIEVSPSRLGSAAFLDCAALLSEMAGILCFLACLLSIHQSGQWSRIWVGVGLWALFDAIAFIALNPGMVNLTIANDVAAGEEAIGILSFLVKAIVRMVPLAYGIGAIVGTVGLLFGTISLAFTADPAAGIGAIRLIVLCTILPFASYVLFAFYHLTIDLLRAILILPSKLDRNGGDD